MATSTPAPSSSNTPPSPPLAQDLHRAERAYTAALQTSAPELAACAARAGEDVSFLSAVDLPRHMLSVRVGGSIGTRAPGDGGDATTGGGGGPPVSDLPLNRLVGASADTLAAVVEVRKWQRQLVAVFEEVSDKNASIRFALEGSLRDRKAAADAQLSAAAAEIDRIRGTSEQALGKGLAGAKAVLDEVTRVSAQLDAVRQELAAIDQVRLRRQ